MGDDVCIWSPADNPFEFQYRLYIFWGWKRITDLGLRRTGAVPWVFGIFLSVAAKETGFLLQPAGEKRCNFLEQVCSRARTFPCAIPSCHGGVRCLSGVAGHGLRTFYRELYSQEHAHFYRGVPDLLSHRDPLCYYMWKYYFRSVGMRFVYPVFPSFYPKCANYIL